jgi:hypothetical protein
MGEARREAIEARIPLGLPIREGGSSAALNSKTRWMKRRDLTKKRIRFDFRAAAAKLPVEG